MKEYNKNRQKTQKNKTLTSYELFIFEKIRKHYMTPEQTLKQRNNLTPKKLKSLNIEKYPKVSIKAIYKTIKSIENKLNSKIMLTKEDSNIQKIPTGSVYRLHAQAFTIKIIESTPKYIKRLEKSNIIINDNNTISLYEGKIVMWSNTDFFGKTVQDCLDQSANYWNNFIKKIQLEEGLLLIKRGNTKIYEFRKHIARINDPLAKKTLKEGKEFKIFDDSGELIFIIDDSFKLKELEAVHKEKCVSNMSRVESMYKDLDCRPDSLNLSELTDITSSNSQIMNKLLKQNLLLQEQITNLIKANEVLTQDVTLLAKSLILERKVKSLEGEEQFKPSLSYFQ